MVALRGVTRPCLGRVGLRLVAEAHAGVAAAAELRLRGRVRGGRVGSARVLRRRIRRAVAGRLGIRRIRSTGAERGSGVRVGGTAKLLLLMVGWRRIPGAERGATATAARGMSVRRRWVRVIRIVSRALQTQ